MSNYYSDAGNQRYNLGVPMAAGGHQARSMTPFAPFPSHMESMRPSATFTRAPSTPPTMGVTPEAAAARMFGPTGTKAAKSATKRFAGLLRRKSTGHSGEIIPTGHHPKGPPVSLPPLPHPHRPAHLPTPDGSHHYGQLNPLDSLQHHHHHLPQLPQLPHLPQPVVPDNPMIDELVKSLGITEAFHKISNAIASAPLPVLSEAAQMTMSILAVVSNNLRGAKYNEISAKSLAAHVVNLISYIIDAQEKRQRERRPVEPGLEAQLNQLLPILHDIKAFLEEQGNRSRLSKAVTYKSDAQKLRAQRELVSNALAEFQLRSSVSDQDRVSQIDKRLQDIQSNMMKAMARPDAPVLILPSNFPQPRSSKVPSRPASTVPSRPASTVPSRHFSQTPVPSSSHISSSTAPVRSSSRTPVPSAPYLNPTIIPSRPPSRAPTPSRPPSRTPQNFSYYDPSTVPPLPQNPPYPNSYMASRY